MVQVEQLLPVVDASIRVVESNSLHALPAQYRYSKSGIEAVVPENERISIVIAKPVAQWHAHAQ